MNLSDMLLFRGKAIVLLVQLVSPSPPALSLPRSRSYLILSAWLCDLRWRLHQQNKLKKQEALHLRLSLHQLITAFTMPHADSALVPEQYVFPFQLLLMYLLFEHVLNISPSIQTKTEFWDHIYTQVEALIDGQRHWVLMRCPCRSNWVHFLITE